MREFYFDTANLEFIKETSDQLINKIDSKLIKGVTTNPNAFSKIDQYSLYQWIETAEEIVNFIHELRGDDEGEIHIQLPYSKFRIEDALKFADHISNLPKDKIKVGMKIPPFNEFLKNAEELNQKVLTNVTGVTDHATAMKCISYGVNYVSIIPGRMEEVGIDAVSIMTYLFSSNHKSTRIISGSMRTLDQLVYTFQLNTIPTIGERVWPLLLDENNLEKIINIDYSHSFDSSEFSPNIDNRSYDLSVSFFEQMDELGVTASEDLKNI